MTHYETRHLVSLVIQTSDCSAHPKQSIQVSLSTQKQKAISQSYCEKLFMPNGKVNSLVFILDWCHAELMWTLFKTFMKAWQSQDTSAEVSQWKHLVDLSRFLTRSEAWKMHWNSLWTWRCKVICLQIVF